MRSHRFLPCLLMVLVVGGTLAGCSRGPSEEELKRTELEQQFVTIQQLNETLQQARTSLAEARAAVAEIEAVPERRRSEEQNAQLAELEAQIGDITSTQEATFEELQGALAEFLNVALNDFPDLPETEQALTIYSEEAIVVADDIVVKSGDYKKAIDHLTSAGALWEAAGLETYPALTNRIQQLDDWRFIVQERFDAVKNGMTKEQVKEVIGVPYYQNIQVDEKRGVEMWLYRKREGGAAGIYFKTKTDKVYSKNFDAVKMRVAD